VNIISYCSINKNGVNIGGKTVFVPNPGKLQTEFDEIVGRFEIVYPKYFKMDAMSRLGFLTSEILMKHLPEDAANRYSPYDCGILTANRSSSLDTDRKYMESRKRIPGPALFVYTLPNVVNAEICIRNGFKGENMFFLAGDFVSSGVIEFAEASFKTGAMKFCLCGWIELLDEDACSLLFAIDAEKQGTGEKLNCETASRIIAEINAS
jgi:hypothetical protein